MYAKEKATAILSIAFLLVSLASVSAQESSGIVEPSLKRLPYKISANGNYLVDGISDRAFIHLTLRWPISSDEITRIPVCWEHPLPRHAALRALVKEHIIATWQQYAAIEFENWGPCSDADKMAIRIAVGSYWPESAIGTEHYNKPAGMKLNFDFRSPRIWRRCMPTREACIVKTAVHEFGHALGFVHEQTRSDTPDECLAEQPGEKLISVKTRGFTTGGTPWDIHSVMNYCNPTQDNDGVLSDSDKIALQFAYGVPKH